MSEEGIYESQKLNCNCNDCKFMVRSFEHRQNHEDYHYQLQKDHFDLVRRKLLKKADEWYLKYLRGYCSEQEARDKQKELLKESKKMVFQFDGGKLSLSYGYCTILGVKENQIKIVSFIPDTYQDETQYCFKHRKD